MAIKPITRYGTFTPTGVDRSAETRMRALAGLGEQLQEMAIGTAKRKREEEAIAEGTEAGRQAALEGKDPELKSTFKYGGANYNAALQKAYNLESYSVIDSHINEAATQHPDNVIEYQKVLDSKMQGMLEGAPEQFQGDLEAYYRRSNRVQFGRIQGAEKKKINSQLSASLSVGSDALEDQIGNLARAGNAEEALEIQLQHQMDLMNGVELGLITALDAETRIAKVTDEIAIQTQEGEVDRVLFDSDLDLKQRAEEGLKLVKTLRETPLSELGPKQNDILLKRLETKVNSVVAEYNKSVAISDAELRKQNGINNVDARIKGDVQPTSDVITDSDIDNHYNIARLEFTNTPEMTMDERISYATSVSAVPKTMKTEILSELRSNEPAKVLVAAQSIMELNALQGMPEAFTGQDVIYADTLYRNMEFYEFDEALERAKAIAFPSLGTQKAMVEARKSELSVDKAKRNEMYVDKLEKAYTGIFGLGDQFTPNNIERDAMIADLKSLTEDNYLLGFEDFDSALEYSLKKMKNSYKTSEFGFLQHAPEEYYGIGPNKDTSWIRQSLHEELVTKYGNGFEPDDIILISDTETSTMARKGMPTYQAFIRMENGSLQPVDERVNPSLDYPAVLEKYKADIKEKSQVPVLNKRQFLTEHKMTPEQNAKAREILQRSTNPFALIGKAIDNIDEVPEFIAKYFEGVQGEIRQSREVAQEQSREAQEALFNWNEQYIANLKKASGREDVEITIADLSN